MLSKGSHGEERGQVGRDDKRGFRIAFRHD